MNIEIINSSNIKIRLEQIAKIHLLAYSSDHFTSGFGFDKLIQYNLRLIEASDLSVVAVDNNEVLGFIIAGENVAAGVSKFTRENRGWLMLQLVKRPSILLTKIISMIRIRINPTQPSKAKFRLLSISTTPGSQSKGVGKEMLHFFEQELLRRGVPYYGLSVKNMNRRAIKFYERHGFVKEKEYLGSSYYLKKLVNQL
jgi:ribosomal protein S18 acetylase RimI-like enzyme